MSKVIPALDRERGLWQRSGMKVIKPPQSGSLANVTASRNRFGQYERSRAIPTQPRTAKQVAVRATLGTVAAAWRGLTDMQRAAWTAFGNSFTILNSLGTAIHLTGSQCFVKINAVNLLNGDVIANDPPLLPSFGTNPVSGITVTVSPQAVKATCGTIASGTDIMVYATAPCSPGRSFIQGFRYVGTFTTPTAGALDITSAYNAAFGSVIAGVKVCVKAVQSIDGFQDNGAIFGAVAA